MNPELYEVNSETNEHIKQFYKQIFKFAIIKIFKYLYVNLYA